MKIIRTIKELSILENSQPVILVPTMGALHDGHRKLIKEGKSLSSNRGTLVVSIYVNPIQFNSEEDLEKYPRTFNEDSKVCEEEGVDIIFLPTGSKANLERMIFGKINIVSYLVFIVSLDESKSGIFRVCMY